MAPRVIVVGGGCFFGGNSTKATSGINGALTRTQVDSNIQDSVQQFYNDTLKSARDKARPDLIKVLTYKSAAAVEWLQDVFSLDLTLVSRLGGHSQPRTHRGHDAKFPGMAITYALMQRLEELAEKEPERVKIIKKARVTKLNKEGNKVTGLDFEHEGKTYTEDGPVILATGGYAADFTDSSLLKKYRSDVYGLATTNGTHATGDGQKMVMEIGGNGIDLDKVQVHPTGLVDPKDPGSKWKFLAAEALRGEGGLLLNAEGNRFCDELGHRDYVSGEMFKNKFPIRLILNSKSSNVLDFHTRHYSGRGLMRKMTGQELAKEIGCGPQHLQKVFKEYNDIADGKKKDPYGKKFFHNGPFDVNDDFHVALMEPVLHFTMGGVEIDDKARVLNSEKKPFDGLFACGELAGGVHGANRLGGSSLLGCVVYGRVAGDSASEYLFQQVLTGAPSSAAARLNQISLHLDPNNPGRLTIEWAGQGPSSEVPGANVPSQTATRTVFKDDAESSDPGAVEKPAAKKEFSIPEKEYTMEEVAKHNKKEDVWVVVKGLVMDLSGFLEDHPGGVQAIVNFAGRDATEEFAMLHDDEVIPKYAPATVIGRVKGVTPKLDL
ncbi:FAD binding domain-domain-containing protein [Tuber borchii]|uniref:fumarate reductase (NADH) n=1 Tax=Tuber borchii TaxID=42251 RepID=A0A2T6ZT09_TUBBO|nr:FAD binding domain-domain-containing protein [Tuber borchii]